MSDVDVKKHGMACPRLESPPQKCGVCGDDVAQPVNLKTCICGEPRCTGVNDGAYHQCGGPREACGINGCPECGAKLPGPSPVEVKPGVPWEQRYRELEADRRGLLIAKYSLIDRVRDQHDDHLEAAAEWRSQAWAMLGQVIYQSAQARSFVGARNEAWREGRRNYDRARKAEAELSHLRADNLERHRAYGELHARALVAESEVDQLLSAAGMSSPHEGPQNRAREIKTRVDIIKGNYESLSGALLSMKAERDALRADNARLTASLAAAEQRVQDVEKYHRDWIALAIEGAGAAEVQEFTSKLAASEASAAAMRQALLRLIPFPDDFERRENLGSYGDVAEAAEALKADAGASLLRTMGELRADATALRDLVRRAANTIGAASESLFGYDDEEDREVDEFIAELRAAVADDSGDGK